MKRILVVLAMLLAAAVCAQAQARTFTDSLGREVTLDHEITRIAVTGPLAQSAVFAIAPDMLVGVSSEWDEAALPYIPQEYHDLPVIGQLYGGKGNLNLEQLLLCAPQVIIDVGEAKKGAAEDLDALSLQTGIPFVHISAPLDALDGTYAMLGELLGRQERAAELGAFCRETYDRALSLSQRVDKTRLLYITGEEGMGVIARGSYHSSIIDMMGENLAVVDAPSSKGLGNEVGMEQILIWNPDVILFSNRSIYEQALEEPVWQSVAAVASGRVYLVPVGPYNWMGFPPGVQRLLGMLWMGSLLYEEADWDLYEQTARYFDLFYHCTLERAQFDGLMKDALDEKMVER